VVARCCGGSSGAVVVGAVEMGIVVVDGGKEEATSCLLVVEEEPNRDFFLDDDSGPEPESACDFDECEALIRRFGAALPDLRMRACHLRCKLTRKSRVRFAFSNDCPSSSRARKQTFKCATISAFWFSPLVLPGACEDVDIVTKMSMRAAVNMMATTWLLMRRNV